MVIWRSIEDAHQGQSWPERYRPRYISAALNSNLLDAKSWDISLPYDISSLNKHDLVGVLEGNIVHAESGLALVLRTESLMTPNRGLMIPLQPHKQSYYPARFINLPGGTKKFTIRRDEITKQYITLTNPVTASCIGLHPSHVRNQLSLVSSRDLETWSVHTTLLSHNDAEHHGFQYADWVICDNDILGVVRTAAPYGNELPHNYHDANQLQFFRINNFRALIT